jgi:anti-anti-sigma factor
MTTATMNVNPETVSVLRLAGDIGPSEMDPILRELTLLVLENKNKVVLNFRQVRHISFPAIAKLERRKDRFRSLGGDVKLVGLIPYVENLFKLVGAFSRFDVAADEEEAVCRFGT